jgi:hypothetical protein
VKLEVRRRDRLEDCCKRSVDGIHFAKGMMVWSLTVEGSRSLEDWICVMMVDVRRRLVVV